MNKNKFAAIVTGGARGIGFSIAKRLSEDGFSIAILDIDRQRAEHSASELGDAVGIGCDVSSVQSIERAIDEAAEHLGKIDAVVNNAGILHNTPILEVNEDEWDRVLAVNLKSTFFVTQKCIAHLMKSTRPRVINISSLAGRMGGFETGMAYSASKGGIIALTMGLARQLATHGITVNAICPGTVQSEMAGEFSPAAMANLLGRVPLGRLGTPEDVASAAAFLASEQAGFITGLLMDVNGGMYMG